MQSCIHPSRRPHRGQRHDRARGCATQQRDPSAISRTMRLSSESAHNTLNTTTGEIPSTVTIASSSGSSSSAVDDAAPESLTAHSVAVPVEISTADADSQDAHCTLHTAPRDPSADTRGEAPASTAPTSMPPTQPSRALQSAPSSLPLSLGSTPLFTPLSTTGDQPPPYSPTHTLLPHYFSLEPIPLRSYLINDSAAMPFLYDFYLSATTSASRPQSPTLQLQERGLTPQAHPSELKYCIIRPQRTDRTAIPITNTLGPNTDLDFIPALALVAANYPARWIWWGTEALQMVVFGRQLKNVIMEWKWKHGRTRIGGPIVHRLIGCSFRVAPDRRYCWRAGSGKQRIHVDATGSQPWTAVNAEGHSGGNGGGSRTMGRRHRVRELALPARTDLSRTAAGGGWFNSFFTRTNNGSGAESGPGDVPLNDVRASPSPIPYIAGGETEGVMSEQPQASSGVNGVPLSVQEATADGSGEVDEELGCYHCREESPSGAIGRIVAVYRPGRPANRARDRPATSRRLEIYAEVGDRCETAMMLMCTRLDDLFMSIPEEKKNGVFLFNNGGSDGALGHGSPVGRSDSPEVAAERNNLGRESGEDIGVATRPEDRELASDQRSEISMFKRLFAGRYTWRAWLKWTVAAILITVVVALIIKPKISG
ncbi:unnamed protein product [Mortierella alpina]